MTLTRNEKRMIANAPANSLIVRWSANAIWTDAEFEVFPAGYPVGYFDNSGQFIKASDADIIATARVPYSREHSKCSCGCTNAAQRRVCERELIQQLIDELS